MEDQHGNIFTQIHSLHSHCHFSQEYLQYERSFSTEVSELCKCHLPNPREFMATEEIFSSTLLLTGWVILAKIGTVISLKLMPRVDTAYSVLQKTNCNFNNGCANSIVTSGYWSHHLSFHRNYLLIRTKKSLKGFLLHFSKELQKDYLSVPSKHSFL